MSREGMFPSKGHRILQCFQRTPPSGPHHSCELQPIAGEDRLLIGQSPSHVATTVTQSSQEKSYFLPYPGSFLLLFLSHLLSVPQYVAFLPFWGSLCSTQVTGGVLSGRKP